MNTGWIMCLYSFNKNIFCSIKLSQLVFPHNMFHSNVISSTVRLSSLRKNSRQDKNVVNNPQDLQLKNKVNQKIIARKLQPLPDIQSPFLKQTVRHLFFQKNSQDFVMSKRYSEEKRVEPIVNQPIAKNTYQDKKMAKIFNSQEIPFEIIDLGVETQNISQRIIKSQSEIKPIMFNLKEIQTIQVKSKGFKLNKSRSIMKISTESSVNSEGSSKDIYQRLKELKQKDTIISKQQQNNLNKEKQTPKQLKKSIFVLKHKLNQELYNQQREQIKLVKNLMKDSSGTNLGHSLQIKNYTKFFPKIISIQSL